jgi:ergothioneine biosynthesis protein EgtB
MAPRGYSSASMHVVSLGEEFAEVRAATVALAQPLSAEDQMLQSMPDASPTKWHLAHTTWFFETFILVPAGLPPVDGSFAHLFNSYYESVGPRVARPSRGLLSRPSLVQVHDYRRRVDDAVLSLLQHPVSPQVEELLTLGLHHEQQHQELILTDIKHALAQNPTHPAYRPGPPPAPAEATPLTFTTHAEGLTAIGHQGGGFAFDNEGPRHRQYLRAFALADRLVTAGEYLQFMEDGGYRQPAHWLSDGWEAVRTQGWSAPAYWERTNGGWIQHTLTGTRPVHPAEPVCHLSQYEADAYARWAGARLPTEAEWEHAAAARPVDGNFVESGRLHPAPGRGQLFGDVWEWTSSAYAPYPGYRPPPGALGEYNGKFMSSQVVLRGGSCLSPRSHLRPTYRNFFPPGARWQMSGVRLAHDVEGA